MLWITLLSMRQIDVEMMVVAGGCEANVAAARSALASYTNVGYAIRVLMSSNSCVIDEYM